jgi:hypothetical protein
MSEMRVTAMHTRLPAVFAGEAKKEREALRVPHAAQSDDVCRAGSVIVEGKAQCRYLHVERPEECFALIGELSVSSSP